MDPADPCKSIDSTVHRKHVPDGRRGRHGRRVVIRDVREDCPGSARRTLTFPDKPHTGTDLTVVRTGVRAGRVRDECQEYGDRGQATRRPQLHLGQPEPRLSPDDARRTDRRFGATTWFNGPRRAVTSTRSSRRKDRAVRATFGSEPATWRALDRYTPRSLVLERLSAGTRL